MFAGIVEAVARVAGITPGERAPNDAGDAIRIQVDLGELLEGLSPGASVAVNGTCLTLTEPRRGIAAFDVVPETWRQTTLQYLEVGEGVNIERSLRVGDRLDGHFVQGHVDGIGVVDRIQRQSGEYKLWVATDPALMPYVVRKGSIALDGTSLTVVDVEQNRFSVVLIPTTLERTVLGRRRAGDKLNIETDILARLVVSRLEQMGNEDGGRSAGVTWDSLRESGFLS